MVSRDLWQRLPRPLEKYIPVVSALTLLTQKKKMGNPHYRKGRRRNRRRYCDCRDSGDRLHSPQIHGSAHDHNGTVIHAAPDGLPIPFWSPLFIRLDDGTEKNWHLPRNGRSVFRDRPTNVSRQASRLSQASVSWTLFSRLPRAVQPLFREDLEPENHDPAPDCQMVSTQISSSTSAAGSEEMR